MTVKFAWDRVPNREPSVERFLCWYAGRLAEVANNGRGWSLHWQCPTRIAPDQEWDCEIKWPFRLCEFSEAALSKAEEILRVEWLAV